jgi:hypothetical protein
MPSIRSCYRAKLIYTRQVRISWNFLCLTLLAAAPFLLGGCGGFSASRSVSPLDFLLPGIIKADPAQTNAPVAFTKDSVQLASAR